MRNAGEEKKQRSMLGGFFSTSRAFNLLLAVITLARSISFAAFGADPGTFGSLRKRSWTLVAACLGPGPVRMLSGTPA